MSAKEIGKTPPSDVELEKVVLGAILLERHALEEVADILEESTFYNHKHQHIFRAVQELHSENEPIDMMTVAGKLNSLGKLKEVGGPLAIAQLTERISSSANIVNHSRMLKELAMRRFLIQNASSILQKAYDLTEDVFQLIDNHEQSLFEVQHNLSKKQARTSADTIDEAMSEIEAAMLSENGATGVSCGLTDVDSGLNGWQKGELHILAARPGMGKTGFALKAGRAAALSGKPTAFFSLEMRAAELQKRNIAAEGKVDGRLFRSGQLSQLDLSNARTAAANLRTSPLFIDDTSGLTLLELRAKARRLKAKEGIELIIIDYLQLMSGTSKYGRNGNKEQEVSEISKGLKELAKDLNVPVIALSQLSRAVETRGGDKRPMLSDLRDSGSLEQDSDMVLFLYRPEYYGITEDENGNSTKGLAELIPAKFRNGTPGEAINLSFVGKHTTFEDWSPQTLAGIEEENPFKY
jgi:replicative DNA helicase